MDSTATGSGTSCEGVCKCGLLKHFDSNTMININACVCDRKAILRNSAKLKSQIHAEINDLIETLKERERQLFLEIDEHTIDECEYLLSVAESFHPVERNSTSDLSDVKSSSSTNGEDSKVHSTTFLKKKMEFVANHGFMKTVLQQFGQIVKMEIVPDGTWGYTLENATEVQESSFPESSKFQHRIQEQMRKIYKKCRSKRVSKESSESVESFEVIDKPEHNEDRKYTESLQEEDDIEIVSSPDEFKTRRSCFVNDIHNVLEVQSKEKLSPDFEKIADPAMQIHEQLKGFLNPLQRVGNVSVIDNLMQDLVECLDKANDCKNIVQPLRLHVHANPLNLSRYHPQSSTHLNNQATVSQPNEKSESSGFVSKKALEPSAAIQKTLNRYLVEDNQDMWLATSDKLPRRLQLKT